MKRSASFEKQKSNSLHKAESGSLSVCIAPPQQQARSYCFRSWKGSAISFAFHLLIILALTLISIADPSTDRQHFLTVCTEDMDQRQTQLDFELTPVNVAEYHTPERNLETPSPSVQFELSTAKPKLADEILTDVRPSSIQDWRLFAIEEVSSSKSGQTMKSAVIANSNRMAAMTASAKIGSGNNIGLGSSSQSMNNPGISYFGSRAQGKKFIFIVDGSGSMRGLRWDTAIQELMRCLHELGSDTKFFIIFFDNSERPLFDLYPPTNEYLTNQGKSLELVLQWIQNLRMGGGTRPGGALVMALEMKPDAIFLLSDGQIHDNSIVMLRMVNRDQTTGKPRIPIHTILLMSEKGHLPLQMIAAENGGNFRNVTEREWLAARGRRN